MKHYLKKQKAYLILEHCRLRVKCKSCKFKILRGSAEDKIVDSVLTKAEKSNNYSLSYNAIPKFDLALDIENLGGIILNYKTNFASKIYCIKTKYN